MARALTSFAVAYADQNEADFREFVGRQESRRQQGDGAAGNVTGATER
jgi:hypothetical protein